MLCILYRGVQFLENILTHHVQYLFFRKSCRFLGNVEKQGRFRQGTGDNMAHALCMMDN
jgi:hypothetical protein